MKKIIFIAAIVLVFNVFISCESFVETETPKTQSVSSTVFSDDIGALAAVRGIYHEMIRTGFASGQATSVTVLSGASADEFISYGTVTREFFDNNVQPSSSNNAILWNSAYKSIYYCNSVIEGLEKSASVTAAAKLQLGGEAKFLRAFCYFYLVNLYGEVPLITGTDYRINAVATRSSKEDIVKLILQDLSEAESSLAKDFQFTSSERVRVSSWAATALLARVYLYNKEWGNAELKASSVINQTGLFRIVTDLNSVFLKNSSEAIWQLMPVVPGQNTYEGPVFIPASATTVPSAVSLTTGLISSFEANDKRRISWVGNQTVNGTTIYYALKYKLRGTNIALNEYSMVLRLAEQYLIRAEARAQQSKFSESTSDLDVLRTRAGLPSVQTKVPVPTLSTMLMAIEQERRIELFSEWGHRWFDLKRTGRATTVLQSKAGWNATDVLYPLPQTELVNNPKLNPQNEGY